MTVDELKEYMVRYDQIIDASLGEKKLSSEHEEELKAIQRALIPHNLTIGVAYYQVIVALRDNPNMKPLPLWTGEEGHERTEYEREDEV